MLSRPGSTYARGLRREFGIIDLNIYRIFPDRNPTIINFGGVSNVGNLSHIFPHANSLKIYNANIPFNKYKAINCVSIPIPITKLALTNEDNPSDYIVKPFYSIGGRGIEKASSRCALSNKYYQKFIDNRWYEPRVHAMNWLNIDEWFTNVRIGPENQIAWNNKQGGKFKKVETYEGMIGIRIDDIVRKAKEYAKVALLDLSMDFGAIDFIVDKNKNIYFLEINSSPGFKNLSKEYYYKSFGKLTQGNIEEN